MIPTIPGFAGDLRDDAALGTRAIMDYQYKSINRGEESIYGKLKAAGVDPTKYIFVFNLRSYDRLNKTPALKKQEENSGVTYQQVQRAQAEEVMSETVHGAPGESVDSSSESSSDEEKNAKTRRGNQSRKKRFEDKHDVADAGAGKDGKVASVDSIAKDAMLGEPLVSEEKYEGRSEGGEAEDTPEAKEKREQELENFIQEELYIHGKVCL